MTVIGCLLSSLTLLCGFWTLGIGMVLGGFSDVGPVFMACFVVVFSGLLLVGLLRNGTKDISKGWRAFGFGITMFVLVIGIVIFGFALVQENEFNVVLSMGVIVVGQIVAISIYNPKMGKIDKSYDPPPTSTQAIPVATPIALPKQPLAPKPPASAVVCSSCRRTLKDDAKFCDKCGAPVSKEPPPAAIKICKTKGCGREYPPDVYFCDVCGARL